MLAMGAKYLLLLALLAQASPSPPATGDKAKAKALLAEGLGFNRQGQHAQALEKFQAAYAAYPSPKLWFNIGQVELALDHPVEAVEAFEKFLALVPDAQPDDRKAALSAAAQLGKKLGRLQIKCETIGAEVAVDGKNVGRNPLPGPLWAAPGKHQVTLMQEGFAPATETVETPAGTTVVVVIRLLPAAPPALGPHPNPQPAAPGEGAGSPAPALPAPPAAGLAPAVSPRPAPPVTGEVAPAASPRPAPPVAGEAAPAASPRPAPPASGAAASAASPRPAQRGEVASRSEAGEGRPAPPPAATPPASTTSPPLSPPAAAPPALDLSAQPSPTEPPSEPRPIYTRWWFWTGAGVVVAGAVTTAILLSGKSGSNIPETPLGNHGVFP